MAYVDKCESFTNAIVDSDDMTITEYLDDSVNTYSLYEFIKRWDGVPGVTLSIFRRVMLPPDGRDLE